ncbi:MAG: hypothetical protein H8D22_10675 [Candidatus Cloacimonetes bacterium]|nr:hypothetical protein [Candidatus Cloacimonadota bacterium]
MSVLWRHKFIDLSQDPPSAVTDATTVEMQPKWATYPTSKIALTVPGDVVTANTGWREGTFTDPGRYDVYIDTLIDSSSGPIYISTEGGMVREMVFRNVTITGTADSKETLTIGAGKLSGAEHGGSFPPNFVEGNVGVIIQSKCDRPVFWDSLVVDPNVSISIDVWASAGGQDDTATADIYLKYLEA